MNENFRDDAFINSIIGEGTSFKGEFDLNGLLRIDGDFTGSIRTKGKVLVGRNGRAECTMQAGTVVIGGVMRGEIFSTEKVIILSTGLMLGNITSPRLIVEEGVIIHGTCTISPEPKTEPKAAQGQRPAQVQGAQAPRQDAVPPARPAQAQGAQISGQTAAQQPAAPQQPPHGPAAQAQPPAAPPAKAAGEQGLKGGAGSTTTVSGVGSPQR